VDKKTIKALSDEELRTVYHKLANRATKIATLLDKLNKMPMGLGEKWRKGELAFYEGVYSELAEEMKIVTEELTNRNMVN
jgi:uncharacterized Zn finger protein